MLPWCIKKIIMLLITIKQYFFNKCQLHLLTCLLCCRFPSSQAISPSFPLAILWAATWMQHQCGQPLDDATTWPTNDASSLNSTLNTCNNRKCVPKSEARPTNRGTKIVNKKFMKGKLHLDQNNKAKFWCK